MINEREYPREQLVYHLRMFDKETHLVVGYVSNISPEGVMLMTDKPIPLNRRFEFTLELPHRIEGKKSLDLVAISAWTTENERHDFYDSGYHFERLNPMDRECIARLMCDYGLEGGIQ